MKKQTGSWALLSQGLQLAVTTGLGVYLGYLLDQKLGTKVLCTVIGLIIGFACGIYAFIYESFKAWKQQD